MEDLTKTQLILLALLVSFVTSMATGIVTVTLMDQAPEPVVQTINRIVERTVETVREAVPTPDKTPRQNVITKETTVVVKEEDLITQTIEKNAARVVRISATVGTSSPEEVFAGIGVILTSDGIVAADAASIPAGAIGLHAAFDGAMYELAALSGAKKQGLALYRIGDQTGVPPNEPTPTPKFKPATLADVSSLKLGQTVIALGGRTRTSVAMGAISSLVPGVAGKSEAADAAAIERIETTLTASDIVPGTPVFNIFGELVALAVAPESDLAERRYIAAGELARILAAASSAAPSTPSPAPVSLDRQ